MVRIESLRTSWNQTQDAVGRLFDRSVVGAAAAIRPKLTVRRAARIIASVTVSVTIVAGGGGSDVLSAKLHQISARLEVIEAGLENIRR